MILTREKETLSLLGVKRISYDDIHAKAKKQEEGWRDIIVPGKDLYLGADATLRFGTGDPVDLTDNAFTQFCNLKGVPTPYAKRCLEENPQLMTQNFEAWDLNGDYMLRNYEDEAGNHTCKAIVSNRFTPISNNRVLDLVEQNVDLNRYICNEAFLSPEKMHMRMVDFDNPIETEDKSPLYVGFCVNNNEIGAGSLSVRFFIYRFACKNGIVRTTAGGTMFRQRHLGLTFEDQTQFACCFGDIKYLREQAVKSILEAQKKLLTPNEMLNILEKVKKEMHLTKEMYIAEGDQKVDAADWIQSNYGNNLWGVVNFVTEKAKTYSLDTRLELEMFADRLLMAA